MSPLEQRARADEKHAVELEEQHWRTSRAVALGLGAVGVVLLGGVVADAALGPDRHLGTTAVLVGVGIFLMLVAAFLLWQSNRARSTLVDSLRSAREAQAAESACALASSIDDTGIRARVVALLAPHLSGLSTEQPLPSEPSQPGSSRGRVDP